MSREIDFQSLRHQYRILTCPKPTMFLGGGIGTGKTHVGAVWALSKVSGMVPGQIGLIGANTYGQLRDATLRPLFKLWKKWGVVFKPAELPAAARPVNLRIWTGKFWAEVICRSLEKYEMLSGVELAWAWLDEVWQTKAAAFDLIEGRLRDGDGGPIQNLLTTTLDDPSSWTYERFVDRLDPSIQQVVYAKSADNPFLPPGYVDKLKRTYSPALFDRMCLAKWVSLESGRIYSCFSRAANVSERASFDPALPTLWSHDFNVAQDKPMSSCLGQVKKTAGPDGVIRPELQIFDEIILDSADTNFSIDEYKSRYPDREPRTIIFGDAAGRARDSRSRQSDYSILAGAGFVKQEVPKANPSIRDRHNSVNSLLRNADGDVRLIIHPRCKTLIKGIETGKLKKGASYAEAEAREQHVCTALGYLVHARFPATRPKGMRQVKVQDH